VALSSSLPGLLHVPCGHSDLFREKEIHTAGIYRHLHLSTLFNPPPSPSAEKKETLWHSYLVLPQVTTDLKRLGERTPKHPCLPASTQLIYLLLFFVVFFFSSIC
jgi:hypothetical protein